MLATSSLQVLPTSSMQVLYQDNHVVAFNKPVGLLSQPDRTGDVSIAELALRWALEERGIKYAAPVHRLDRPVSGALLVAVTSKAAKRLSKSLAEGEFQKTYLTVVRDTHRKLRSRDVLRDGMVPGDAKRAHRARCVPMGPGLKLAELEYELLERSGDDALLAVTLKKTGRRHQIRAQLASRGTPIIGDTKYGPSSNLSCCALHAATIHGPHPIAQRPPLHIAAPIPEDIWHNIVPRPLLHVATDYIAAFTEDSHDSSALTYNDQ